MLLLQQSQNAGREYTNIKYATDSARQRNAPTSALPPVFSHTRPVKWAHRYQGFSLFIF